MMIYLILGGSLIFALGFILGTIMTLKTGEQHERINRK